MARQHQAGSKALNPKKPNGRKRIRENAREKKERLRQEEERTRFATRRFS